MKKRQRRLVGLLLACMMTCLPVTQALAETAFEASAGVSGQLLFEKDSLVNAAGAVMLDGAEAAPAGGSWTNTDTDKVYMATTAEDGSIVLTMAGYALVVEDGTSSREAGEDEDNHYEFLDWEKPLEGEPVKDIACYLDGEEVTLIANAPKDGMEFSHWSTDTEGAVIEDPYQMETTILMLDKKVKVKANYVPTAAEPVQPDVPEEVQPDVQPEVQEPAVEIPAEYSVTVNNGEGSGSYAAGDWVSIAAYDRSAENLDFTGWYVDSMNVTLDDTSSDLTGFVMPEAEVVLSATYAAVETEPSVYELVVNNGTGTGSYEESTWVTVTANDRSAENLAFAGWSVDSMNVSMDDPSAATASFSMPAGAVVLTASYTEIQTEPPVTSYEVVVNNGDGSGTYDAGSTVTITAADRTAEGSEFTGWFAESMNVVLEDTSAVTTTFVMPEADVTVTATYAAAETEAPETEAKETESPETAAPETDAALEEETDLITDDPDNSDESELQEEESGAIEEEPDTEEITEAPDEDIVDEPDAEDESEVTVDPEQSETSADDTTDADTQETETDAAQTEAPETDAPQTNAPETGAPETNPTESESGEDVEQKYTLTVENGHGSGSYAAQTTVKVEADVPEGYRFVQWTTTSSAIVITDSTSSMLEFMMPAEDVTITAQFEKIYSVSLDESGNVIFENSNGGAVYAAGETVEISADLENAEGQVFKRFAAYGEDGKEIELTFKDGEFPGTASFVMPEQNITVKAIYKDKPVNYYTVKVSNGLIDGTATEAYVPEGTKIEVKANPGPTGQYFAGWVINDGTFDMGEATYEETIWIDVTQNLTILATYEGYQYEVTVNGGSSDYDFGTVGTVVTIEAAPAPDGMQFDCWYVDSQNVSLADAKKMRTTFTMPDGDVVVSAKYKQIEFAVTVENGTAEKQYYHAGDVVTVKASYPASGRVFDQWVSVSGNISFVDASRWQTTFTMPAADVTVKAAYKDGPSSANNTIQEIVSGGEYLTGSTIRFSASGAGMGNTNPNPGDYRFRPSGYQIGNVTGTWQAAPYSTSMSIKASGEYTLKVIFNKDVFDGSKWVSEGSSDAKSVTFYVVTEAEGVDTGDDTPIAVVIAAAAVSCVLFLILLVVFMRRRSHRK